MIRRWHRPSLLAWLLLAIGLAAFVSLGRWQLQRAADKEQLLAAYAHAENEAPRPFAAVLTAPPTEQNPRVNVRGHFLAERSYLLDEQPHAGRVGVLAVDVFQPEGDARKLLVNRGWVPWSHASGTAPAIPALPAGEVALTGMYAPPPGGGLRVGGNALETQKHWPKLTLYLDTAQIAVDLGGDVYPRLLLLDADPNSGFVREWTPEVMPPERHRGYALQWFSFAIAALVIFFVLHWRKPAPTDSP